jgi:hypothetical protein
MRRFLTALALVMAIAGPAKAVTVNFAGLVSNGQGVIGNQFIDRSLTPWAGHYAAVGVLGPYARLTSPDAFDFVAGGELPIGSNLPAQPYGSTASAPHGLESIGITGTLHLGFAGLTLDYGNTSDLFFTDALHETRFYRNGTARIFEETAPGVFSLIGELTDLVMQVDIDYSTGAIVSTTTGTRSAGTPAFFPELWVGTSFDPIDNAGSTAEGVFGRFSATTSMEFDTEGLLLPEPAMLALFGLGLVGIGAIRRRR